jgi:hypothetical protein
VSKHIGVIDAAFFGHTHDDSFFVSKSINGFYGFIQTSITPNPPNPGVRVFSFDGCVCNNFRILHSVDHYRYVARAVRSKSPTIGSSMSICVRQTPTTNSIWRRSIASRRNTIVKSHITLIAAVFHCSFVLLQCLRRRTAHTRRWPTRSTTISFDFSFVV